MTSPQKKILIASQITDNKILQLGPWLGGSCSTARLSHTYFNFLAVSLLMELPQEPSVAELIGPVVLEPVGAGLRHEQLLQDAESVRTSVRLLALK